MSRIYFCSSLGLIEMDSSDAELSICDVLKHNKIDLNSVLVVSLLDITCNVDRIVFDQSSMAPILVEAYDFNKQIQEDALTKCIEAIDWVFEKKIRDRVIK